MYAETGGCFLREFEVMELSGIALNSYWKSTEKVSNNKKMHNTIK